MSSKYIILSLHSLGKLGITPDSQCFGLFTNERHTTYDMTDPFMIFHVSDYRFHVTGYNGPIQQ